MKLLGIRKIIGGKIDVMDIVNYIDSIKKINLEFAKSLRKKNKSKGSTDEAYSFIISGLKILHPTISDSEIEKSITDGDHDEQIDAIIIRDGYVDIYDFKMSEGFGEKDIRLFVGSMDRLILDPAGDLSGTNELIKKRIPEARKAIDDGFDVRVRVVRGGRESLYSQGEKALKKIVYDSIKKHELISSVDLVERELNLIESPIKYEWSIKVKKNNPKDTSSSKMIIKEGTDIKSLICRISLKELVDLYHNFQPNPEKIFESNVRGLQSSKKVSNQILSSLENTNKAKNFYKLHNGITIVGDKISETNSVKYIISNPQIVNGCQTITTISNHFKSDRAAKQLDYGSVVCKIFSANKSEVESICLASNSQVSINPWDLRTNDNIQIIIESYLNKEGIKYNRKAVRNSSNNELTFKELGQWLCASFLQKPAFSKNSRAKIFDNNNNGVTSIYHQLFNSKTNFSEVKKVVECFVYKNQN